MAKATVVKIRKNMEEAPAKGKAKTKGAPAVKRFAGETSGLGVAAFQNLTFAENLKKRLTDEQLAARWRKEFPGAKKYTAEDVAGVRSVYNLGKHGQTAPPDKKTPEYNDAGEALPFRGEKSDKKAAKASTKKAKVADEEEEIEEEEAVAPKKRRMVK